MTRHRWIALIGLGSACAVAQTHAVKRPEQVVRAVSVYEWTGDEAKPTASRLVPVSLFINGQYQDAAIYLARPVPLALDTGTIYFVRRAGVDEGTLEVAYERHLLTGDAVEVDDGWMGYGAFKMKPRATLEAKKQSGPLPTLVVSHNSADKPHFGSPSTASGGDSGTGSAQKSDDDSHMDSSRPSFHTRPSASTDSSTSSTSNGSAGTPGAASSDPSQTSVASTSAASTDDPSDPADRPTLKRRSPAEIKANQKKKDSARVVAGNDLNDDPDRPTLHRGSETTDEEKEIPPLHGLPRDMHQMVAVSDAKDRPEHDFSRPWAGDEERAQVLQKMEDFARNQLASYKGAAPAPSAIPAPANATPLQGTAVVRNRRKQSPAPSAASPVQLSDEVLSGYTLSYGGSPTYFYSASSPGANGVSRYVSVVAQEEPTTGLKLAIGTVTDSSHLDRTPWMRLVDVVDADASNRASMLMELRAEHTRQFALYRVIGGQAEQVFLTGATQ